ncbi:hypothetical protein SISSUDRAFT_1063628 [Sistotremastrum suecicum HHB10207 ss-3]|uniref:H-type lectin domain-containing protein n=1 Tax=Sistotremastrum suecicum HHB10207 ss-3 TaxID=1314776 RepID=A0A166BK37_9AGAM|nr:hypothetical protein SISSUDRAFT_1063628 [Sistotremastrum suecicum HHB10207 ss-3]
MEIGSWKISKHWQDVAQGESQQEIISLMAQASSPLILTAFTLLDANWWSNGNQLRARCYATDIHSDEFQVHADTWSDSYLYQAVVSWLAIPSTPYGILAGTCSVEPHEARGGKKHRKAARIAFQQAFYKPPKVFLCLNSLDLGGTWGIETRAENITRSGFDAVFESKGSSCLHAAGASWLVYDTSLEGITSGIIDVHEDTSLQKSWAGEVKFKKPFQAPPRIFHGIRRIVASAESNLRISAGILEGSVTTDGFGWKIEGWDDSRNHGIQVAWLAVGDNMIQVLDD